MNNFWEAFVFLHYVICLFWDEQFIIFEFVCLVHNGSYSSTWVVVEASFGRIWDEIIYDKVKCWMSIYFFVEIWTSIHECIVFGLIKLFGMVFATCNFDTSLLCMKNTVVLSIALVDPCWELIDMTWAVWHGYAFFHF